MGRPKKIIKENAELPALLQYKNTMNLIIDEWAYKLKSIELRILLFITRSSIGFDKKSCSLTLQQFERSTLSSKKYIVESIESLIEKDLIKQSEYKTNSQEAIYELIIQTKKEVQNDNI